MTVSDEVICETQGAAGLITLNRPQALNALTLGMVREMRKALDAWADDPVSRRPDASDREVPAAGMVVSVVTYPAGTPPVEIMRQVGEQLRGDRDDRGQ